MNRNGVRVFSIFVLALFLLGFLFLVWNTISKDTSLNDSSADVKNVMCGSLDTNNNVVLDIVDYSELKKLVGKNCIDRTNASLCGSKDINNDGKIDLVDLSLFGKRFNKPNCGK